MATHKKSVAKASVAKKHVKEKHAAAKPHAVRETHSPIITIDRRRSSDRRAKEGPRSEEAAPAVVEHRAMERRAKVSRRRQIDPTTCERDYSPDEVEFMAAIDQYKRQSGRMFPTCSEVLEVLKKLGYEKVSVQEHVPAPVVNLPIDSTSQSVLV